MELAVHDLDGKPVAQIALDEKLWGGRVNARLLSQVIAAYRTNARQGTGSTKTRGEVSGGGKKPWKQKHTGRARAGSIRSPLWRHGGAVFGPHPRPFTVRLPERMRRLGLLNSLKGKVRDEELVIVDHLHADAPKTKPFARLGRAFNVTRRSLIVLHQPGEALVRSLRNLQEFSLCQADTLNALDVLSAQKIVLAREAFQRLEQRVRGA